MTDGDWDKNSEPKYNANVRIGVYNEELFIEEDKIRDFLKKRDTGELYVQQTRRLFSNLLKEIELEAACDYIRFGAVIQVVSPDMPKCCNFIDAPMVLSLNVNEKTILISQKITDKSNVTLAPSPAPCVRNAFKIISADSSDRTNELLKYGQAFNLQCIESEREPLILYSSPKTIGLLNVNNCPHEYYSRDGVNQSVGVCMRNNDKCEFMNCLNPIPPLHYRWRVEHINLDMRFENEGQPVPSNERIIIVHCATNRCLAGEPVVSQTFFGPECGVTCHNYKDICGRPTYQNTWKFQTQLTHSYSS